MKSPTPDIVRAARLAAELTQSEAAALVYWSRADRWSERETGKADMPPCEWELFLLKAFPNPAARRPFIEV